MKRLFIHLLLLFPALAAQAQPPGLWQSPFGKETGGITKELPTAKVTAKASVTGISRYSYDSGSPVLSDSAAIAWSGGRRSQQHSNSCAPFIDINDYDQYQTWDYSLIPGYRNSRTYSSSGVILTDLLQEWNTGSWINTDRAIYTFSSSGWARLIEQWKHGAWEPEQRHTVTGAASSREYRTEKWTGSTWINTLRETGLYSSGCLTEFTRQGWDDHAHAWENQYRELNIYSGSKRTECISQKWDIPTGAWINENRYRVIFTGGLVTEYIRETWNAAGLSWDNKLRGFYTYAGSNLTEQMEQVWDALAVSWENNIQVLYTYSGSQVSGQVQQRWDASAKNWSSIYGFVYGYNTDAGLVSEQVSRLDIGIPKPLSQTKYYYATGTGIAATPADIQGIRLYPNPAAEAWAYADYTTTAATATEVSLTDLNGRLLFRSSEPGSIGDHSVAIPVAGLAAGVYLVQLSSEGQKVQTLKLVK
jgi:hypothetical protein